MKTNKINSICAIFIALITLAFVATTSTSVLAQGTIQVYAFTRPIIPVSPSAAQFVDNYVNMILSASWVVPSDPNDPTSITLIPNGGSVPVTSTVYTPYMHSWNGTTNVTEACAGEYGQGLCFAVVINNPTETFIKSQVSYIMSSSGSVPLTGNLSSLNYGTYGRGYVNGPGGRTEVSYGAPSSTPVNTLIFLGTGIANIVMRGQSIEDVVQAFTMPDTYVTTFSLGDVTSTPFSVTITPVPEPTIIAIGLLGLLATVLLRRRRLNT